MLHGDHDSAWRRRQRRLCSCEQQSVAMALSAAAHHSFDTVAAGVTHDGLRALRDVFINWKPYLLALVGRPSLHGDYACMVYWTQGAPRRNCRQIYGETSFSPFRVFMISRNSRDRFWGLVFWHLWIGRARHPGPLCYFSPFWC